MTSPHLPVRSVEGAAVIGLVDEILEAALAADASDLYVEPTGSGYRVRFRVDGVLSERCRLDVATAERAIARIKVLARLAVHRTAAPQEGRLVVPARAAEVRVSVVPTVNGERAVLRLLGAYTTPPRLGALGFEPALVTQIESVLARSQGVFFVCGPAGSGKTTTLHACLEHVVEASGDQRTVCTLEDPVERNLGAIAQTDVDPERGLDFAGGLRALLRQDPEVLMVGETRDAETARIALQAGLTGHLVLSSLHTSSSIEALMRLTDLGAGLPLLASALQGVLTQRLVRRTCVSCEGAGGGCGVCGGRGLRGRRALGELLLIDDRMRRAMRAGASPRRLDRVARLQGLRPLEAVAAELVARGETTAAEVARVIAGSTVR